MQVRFQSGCTISALFSYIYFLYNAKCMGRKGAEVWWMDTANDRVLRNSGCRSTPTNWGTRIGNKKGTDRNACALRFASKPSFRRAMTAMVAVSTHVGGIMAVICGTGITVAAPVVIVGVGAVMFVDCSLQPFHRIVVIAAVMLILKAAWPVEFGT